VVNSPYPPAGGRLFFYFSLILIIRNICGIFIRSVKRVVISQFNKQEG